MSLVSLIVFEALLLILIWAVHAYAPEPPKRILVVIFSVGAAVVALVWLVGLARPGLL